VVAFEVIGHADAVDWLEMRRTGIGASEIAAILGESPWAGPLKVYADKVLDGPGDDLSGVEAVEWGRRLEGPIIEAYGQRTGRATRRSGELLRSTAHPWAMTTLDGWTVGPFEECPLEVKAVGLTKGDEWEDGPPRHYYLQLQHQMLVTGCSQATIAALIGGQRMVWCDVPRDEIEIRRIIEHGSAFWQRVVDLRPPEPDGTPGARSALHALYPEDTGEVIELPATTADTLADLIHAKSEAAAASAKVLELENRIKAALGSATTGHVGGYRVSWKLQERKEYVVKASSTRVLRVKEVA
jgi:putative phage-type endonuclease